LEFEELSEKAPEILEKWVKERQFAPLRFILSGKKGNWFAWMLHGDFLAGSDALEGMTQAALDSRKSYTSIHCVAVGVQNTWILIWEDVDMRYRIEEKYPLLHKKLKGLRGDDVSVSDFKYSTSGQLCVISTADAVLLCSGLP
jgi:hypothetical protein